ncbi:uncharacterized protein LOC128674667 isoform X2 [Plodia interpunctella]|uniref:uncharacterized protein LOC128674667 isoform X2 n=1 Tax=Plodia interpunctella TaxID=58824 RepID=UPI002367E3F4|nr:uncharacterized protein LOC128674667 isoform X2 [Plodia interpunctella]
MSHTHVNSPYSTQSFTPREITTPNKDFPGTSKTVFTHVSNLHSLLSDWARIREKGSKFCRGISALKLYECADDYYPHQLKPLIEGLLEAVDGVILLNNQLKSLSKLPPIDQPVIFTWTTKEISDSVEKMCLSLQKECKLKEVVAENVAHCRNDKLLDVYISAWELDTNFEYNAYLFAEVGLSGVT